MAPKDYVCEPHIYSSSNPDTNLTHGNTAPGTKDGHDDPRCAREPDKIRVGGHGSFEMCGAAAEALTTALLTSRTPTIRYKFKSS